MDTFSRELNDLMMDTYRSIGILEEAMLKDLSHGALSISELHMIEAIGKDMENGRSITDLAQEQNITLPSVTICIKKLEKKGFVTKTRCEEDGRRVTVRLTEPGRRVEVSHRFFHRQMARAIPKDIPIEEQDVLLRALTCMNRFFRQKAEAYREAGDQQKKEGTAF